MYIKGTDSHVTICIQANTVSSFKVTKVVRPGLRSWIRIMLGSWIRIHIKEKSWIWIHIKVKIQELYRLKMELRMPWMLTMGARRTSCPKSSSPTERTKNFCGKLSYIFLRAFFAFLDLDLNTDPQIRATLMWIHIRLFPFFIFFGGDFLFFS